MILVGPFPLTLLYDSTILYHMNRIGYLSWLFFLLPHRLHGRYHEMAPNVVPMDYTKDPDVKLPMQLIINMPELKVRLLTAYKLHLVSSASCLPEVLQGKFGPLKQRGIQGLSFAVTGIRHSQAQKQENV